MNAPEKRHPFGVKCLCASLAANQNRPLVALEAREPVISDNASFAHCAMSFYFHSFEKILAHTFPFFVVATQKLQFKNRKPSGWLSK